MMKKFAVIAAAFFLIGLIAVMINPFLLFIPMILSGLYEGPHNKTPLKEAHQRAVKSFVESKGFGFARMQRAGLWNEHSVVYEGVTCKPMRVRLIGLTPEHGFRYFMGHAPPRKHVIGEAETRPLTEGETEAVNRILAKPDSMERLPADEESAELEAIRVVAPIHSRHECLECHAGKSGDVLGAFEYLLIPY